jgi:hypothetical protein
MADSDATVRGLLADRARAYGKMFDTEEGQMLLADLMKFAHFGETVFHPDQRMTDVLIGRQEVLHRILDYAHLSPDELYVKYSREKFNPRKE